MYKLPEKSDKHVPAFDVIKYGKDVNLVPGKTPTQYGHTLRHRTQLDHPCWFSRKPHIKKLSVLECIQRHPKYMLWIYKNLNINWSVHVIEKLEILNKNVETTESAMYQWLAQ